MTMTIEDSLLDAQGYLSRGQFEKAKLSIDDAYQTAYKCYAEFESAGKKLRNAKGVEIPENPFQSYLDLIMQFSIRVKELSSDNIQGGKI